MKEGSMFRQKYFEDYSRRVVLDEKSRRRVEYVYEGTYYLPEAGRAKWYAGKLICLALTMAAGGTQIWSMAENVWYNHINLIAIFQALALLAVFGMAVCALWRAAASRRMTKWDYRMAVISLKEFTLVAIVLLGIAVLITAVYLFGSGLRPTSDEAAGVAKGVCSLLFLGTLSVFLKKEQYRTEESRDVPHGLDVTDDFMG